MNDYLAKILRDIRIKNSNEYEFLQAAEEVLNSLEPALEKYPEFEKFAILERMTEPERLISFRVSWIDDNGQVRVNRGWRVQFSNLIGPYKGGLRFHPSVNQSIMKFLAFEQIFKNALTGFPIGGGKGGSDFDPKNKSDNEIMNFCQNFMNELYRHIGQDVDVPAGDIGVGAREIGFLFGQYKKIRNTYEGGALTGKGLEYGGSLVRTQATGYGLIYFMREMLKAHGKNFKNKTVTISGSGNVAIYACEKAQEYGAKIVAMSDSSGCIYDRNGINLQTVKQIKEIERGRIKEYVEHHPGAEYLQDIWGINCDIALPCATQNEINLDSAKKLAVNGVSAIGEGANMPLTKEASAYLLEKKVLIAPAKAANAGGVAVSAIEISQNSMRYYWSFDDINEKLDCIMTDIFNTCQNAVKEYGLGCNYSAGANIASFIKLAKAMLSQGVV